MNWDADVKDYVLAGEISQRANRSGISGSKADTEMDILATHLNGNPLDLESLADAPQADFVHDVIGIARHLNRSTGALENCFRPRYSV